MIPHTIKGLWQSAMEEWLQTTYIMRACFNFLNKKYIGGYYKIGYNFNINQIKN